MLVRRLGRLAAAGFTAGAVIAGGMVAGVTLDPLRTGGAGTDDPPAIDEAHDVARDAAREGLERAEQASGQGASGPAGDVELQPDEIPDIAASTPDLDDLPAGAPFLAGAARASLEPAPDVFGEPGDRWERHNCTAIDEGNLEHDHVVPSLADARGWPAASPDCIYLGGFGIGPARPAREVDDGGVWVRAVAVSNGTDHFVYAIADTVGWFARYEEAVCSDCGILDVRQAVADGAGLPVANVVIGSTHTHAGADTYGGWGGIPHWYRNQIRDAATAAAKQALANLEPARLLAGETNLRDRNGERRDTYFSNADTGATYLQARRADESVIATWAAYAGHPTIVDETVLHADWPGAAARHFEADHPGSVGVMFEGGLGNVSISEAGGSGDDERAERAGRAVAAGILADLAANAVEIVSTDMATAVSDVTHPTMTNPGLTTLASAGLFDREFTPGTPGAGLPGTYHWSKQGEASTADLPPGMPDDPAFVNGCTSSGPTIVTTVGAHRIGEFAVAFAPGEIFSNIAEVVKEEADRSAVTMVLGQTNDALGYIIQSFEFDTAANVFTEYGTQTHEYEEVFSIDRCFGDHVLQTLLDATSALGF